MRTYTYICCMYIHNSITGPINTIRSRWGTSLTITWNNALVLVWLGFEWNDLRIMWRKTRACRSGCILGKVIAVWPECNCAWFIAWRRRQKTNIFTEIMNGSNIYFNALAGNHNDRMLIPLSLQNRGWPSPRNLPSARGGTWSNGTAKMPGIYSVHAYIVGVPTEGLG